ncbi:fimbrial protein [Achromobacter anxifer]
MNTLQKLFLLCATLLSLAFSPNAAAASLCTSPHTMYIYPPAEIKFNAAALDGDVLWAGKLGVSMVLNGQCPSGMDVQMHLMGVGSQVRPNVYASGIAGVGYRITTNISQPACLGGVWPLYCKSVYGPHVPVHTLDFELVKTGPIGGGRFITMVGYWRPYGQATGTMATLEQVGGVTLKPQQPPTCSFASTGPIQASLGNVSAKSFKGVGSTSAARPFSIDLTCQRGDGVTSIDAHVTLTDATDAGNYSKVLTLSPDSQAKGVKIEVLSGTTVLGYGPDSNAAGNLNQWKAGTVSAGATSYSIPLTTRYVQTDSVVTPGTANGRATFTMSYQ